jgi:lipoprotein-anchoring transpeptidase ErfK/SrfK
MIEHKIPILRSKLQYIDQSIPQTILYVDIKLQKLFLIEENCIQKTFDISTSKFGTGNRNNSNQTPLGIHRIINKIGHGAPVGRIFRSRIDTGIDWHDGLTEENMILTRILRLEGLEPGVNQGPAIDSYERYIYIHGTNREDLIGNPMSHGCICMRNNEIIELFNSVEEGTIVIID